jgi:hypothetical protein
VAGVALVSVVVAFPPASVLMLDRDNVPAEVAKVTTALGTWTPLASVTVAVRKAWVAVAPMPTVPWRVIRAAIGAGAVIGDGAFGEW